MEVNGQTSKHANGHHAVHNGIASGSISNGGKDKRVKVLSVDEALPYSPFSSAIPFNSDIIPMPSIGLRSSSLFSNSTEREQGRRELDSLNFEMEQDPRTTSQRLQRTLYDLKELLRPEGIAHFNFKIGPKSLSRPNPNEEMRISLSPLAQRVLNETKVEFSLPLPSPLKQSQSIPKASEQHKQRQPPKPTPKHLNPSSTNKQAFYQNQSIEVQLSGSSANSFSTPPKTSPSRPNTNFVVEIPKLPESFPRNQYTPSRVPAVQKLNAETNSRSLSHEQLKSQLHRPECPQSDSQRRSPEPEADPHAKPRQLQPRPSPVSSNPTLAVVIPDLPPTFKPEEYEVQPDSPDTPQHISRKRARSEVDEYEDNLSRGVDQREKADAAFRNLREYLQEIFEAEDQIEPDSFQSNHIFTTTTDGVSLTVEAHSKVEGLLQKVITVGRFLQAPLDDLLHLQRLCEGAMKDSENIDVKVDDTMGASEVDSWLHQIGMAELGIKAARTSLRLMTGASEQKQLYSEDVIQSALDSFKNVTENCIIPIVEMRSSGPSATVFKLLSAQKKVIVSLLTQCRRLFSMMANLIGSIELSETVINTLEFTASKLIFVENAHIERDSILGISKFDAFRVVAMDVLAQIFLSHPSQRQGIFDEILTSLEKLPVTKQSARQFKLAEGGSIQLVSALIMRLTQTSAGRLDDAKEKRKASAFGALNGDDTEEPGHEQPALNNQMIITSETRGEQQPVTAIQELKDVVTPLDDTAKENANYVVSFIVKRAQNSTKSGDAPYRNLLDLFVVDFITCLDSTDWPAAELLLRLFLIKMVNLAEGEKTPAPDKNMALDLLGLMGSAISELNSHVRKTAASLENGDSDLGKYLSRLAESSLEKKASAAEIVSWPCGPFRTCMEYLQERCSSEPNLNTAIGFLETQWALKICTSFDLINDEDDDYQKVEKEYGRLAYRLRMMITDRRWLSTEYSFDAVSPTHARLAYSLTLLNSQFCEGYRRVLMILLGSTQSEQATVRSKSLKSVTQLVDTDPAIIDREPVLLNLVRSRCANDQSVLVRDSALALIGKCINLKPRIEEEMLPSILQRLNDSGVSVRKRAMKLSKDIYLRKSNREARSVIADSLLHRVNDLEEEVRELARQTIEEIWISPFYQTSTTDITSAQYKLDMAEHVTLMVKTVQRGNSVATVLDKVLQNVLSANAKLSAPNFKVCMSLVATMFDTIIDNRASAENEAPSAGDALQILAIFAKSDSRLFTSDQIQLLLPYISNVATTDDLGIYRSVVVIFRHVLPHLKVQDKFLVAVRGQLLQAGLKMNKIILDDVVACLWIISEVLADFRHPVNVVITTLRSIQALRGINPDVKKVSRFLLIAGMCGKHFNLEPHLDTIQKTFPAFKGDSVSKLMCDSFAPFASPEHNVDIRAVALDAIGMVCQSWPKNLETVKVWTSFQMAFKEENSALEMIVMKAFKDFLLLEEKRSEAGHDGLPGAAADPTGTLAVMGGGQGDGAAPALARRYLADITRIALSGKDEQALLATELLASIARQGLLHPKEVGLPLIALETSPNSKISEIAFREHRALHEKHETTLEKEYMRAVQLAYEYQRDVVDNTHGATLNPFASKLHMMVEVLKVSKPKNRKRFFENLCSRIEFDPAKIDDTKDLAHHLDFSQFVIENLAFFEYATIDELLSTINAMEKVVAATGTDVAHSIETEILHISLEQPSNIDENGQSHSVEPHVDRVRLQQLTSSSMMLSSLWAARTHLRRQYNLMTNKPQGKGKAATKDLNKAPMKNPGINGDRFWEETTLTMAAFETEETMVNQCKTFVDLLNFDQDLKIVAEGDEEAERVRLNTPSDIEENSTPATPGPSGGSGRGRKRKAGSATPGGRKKRARSSSVPRQRGRAKTTGKRTSIERSDDESGGGV